MYLLNIWIPEKNNNSSFFVLHLTDFMRPMTVDFSVKREVGYIVVSGANVCTMKLISRVVKQTISTPTPKLICSDANHSSRT